MSGADLLSTTTDDDTLRAVFDHPDAVSKHVESLIQSLHIETDLLKKARVHAELGNFKRGLGDLLSAEQHLLTALTIVESNVETKRQAIIYGIRLAHVYHWQAKWDIALKMFNELFDKTSITEFYYLRDFVLQHRGKMYFDQGCLHEALQDFENALVLRLKKDDSDLVESTRQALTATRRRMSLAT